VFLRLVLRIGLCMRPTDNPAVVPVQVHMQAKDDLIAPTRKENTLLREIVWESNGFCCGWTNMCGALQDHRYVPSLSFVCFLNVRQTG